MVMVMMPTRRLRQILDVRKLTGLRRGCEIRGELIELGRLGGVSVVLRGLRGVLQIRGDLRGDLLVLGRIRLLQLLELAHHLGEGRQLLIIRLAGDGRRAGTGCTAGGRASGETRAWKPGLQIAKKIVNCTHGCLPCM